MSPSSAHLVDRSPVITGSEIGASLVPPRQFATASLSNYRPDPAFPSQAQAVAKIEEFLGGWAPARSSGGGLFGRRRKAPESVTIPGVYLDGGFGVGKTHLLAALWHAAPGPKYFGTFIEYTALVGALGYASAVSLLKGTRLLCIDEFELDDPGDTMIMTRLLGELTATGTRVAATSNTPPNALGEGRFAAADFLREIQSLAANFETLRIDGNDYRQRDMTGHARSFSPEELQFTIADAVSSGYRVTTDDFSALVAHLARIHPSAYIKLIEGVQAIALSDVRVLDSQTDALRLVSFVDRVYDAQIPVFASGEPLDTVFGGDMLSGGYRKKYLRAMSRLVALSTEDV